MNGCIILALPKTRPMTHDNDSNRMQTINLKNEIATFTGPPDSGKSNLVKYMLRLPEYRRHLVYDSLFGYDPDELHVIRPPSRETKWRRYDEGNPELNQAVDKFVLTETENRPHYFVIDEAGRLIPNQKPEGEAMGELNDFNAHYGISVWVIGQRFAQINSDFTNKATHHFVMDYKGRNDKRALRDIHEDLPEALEETSQYGFVYSGKGGDLRRFQSVPEVGKKRML